MNKNSKTDDLILGIKSILSENRHSFTEPERIILRQVIDFLINSKKESIPENNINKETKMQALVLLARFFVEDFDKLKHILDVFEHLF